MSDLLWAQIAAILFILAIETVVIVAWFLYVEDGKEAKR